MSCNCHRQAATTPQPPSSRTLPASPEPTPPQRLTIPTDQCPDCTLKHLDELVCAWYEHGYWHANLPWIRAQLMGIVGHTYRERPDIASAARALAAGLRQPSPTAASMQPNLDALIAAVDNWYAETHPDRQQLPASLEQTLRLVRGHLRTAVTHATVAYPALADEIRALALKVQDMDPAYISTDPDTIN